MSWARLSESEVLSPNRPECDPDNSLPLKPVESEGQHELFIAFLCPPYLLDDLNEVCFLDISAFHASFLEDIHQCCLPFAQEVMQCNESLGVRYARRGLRLAACWCCVLERNCKIPCHPHCQNHHARRRASGWDRAASLY